VTDRSGVEPRARNRLPSVKVLLSAALILGLPTAAWAHGRTERLDVERHAGVIASALTNRSIRVRCPGPVRRRLFYEIREGEVRFDADGVPADETRLGARTCDGLHDVLRRGASSTFACLDTATCPAEEQRAAEALAILTHEIMHLRGTRDEARAECEARARVAAVAARLRVAPEAAQRLARWQATTWQAGLPPQYQHGTC
jgi:hypothetical protein